jgi:hypothetical protein
MKTKKRDPRKMFVENIYEIMQDEVNGIHDSLTEEDGLDSPDKLHNFLLNRRLEEGERIALASAYGVLRASQRTLQYCRFPRKIRNGKLEAIMNVYKCYFEELSERR